MKYLSFAFLLFFVSCKTKTKDELVHKNQIKIQKVVPTESKEIQKDYKKIKIFGFNLNDVFNKEMIGLSVNSKEKKPNKKYLYDVSGACYSCNIANIVLKKDKIILTNVCENYKKTTFMIDRIEKINKRYKIYFIQNNKKVTLSITKVEKLPIYNISLDSDFKKIKDFKVNNFYITEKDLIKLKVHDCGDFEGWHIYDTRNKKSDYEGFATGVEGSISNNNLREVLIRLFSQFITVAGINDAISGIDKLEFIVEGRADTLLKRLWKNLLPAYRGLVNDFNADLIAAQDQPAEVEAEAGVDAFTNASQQQFNVALQAIEDGTDTVEREEEEEKIPLVPGTIPYLAITSHGLSHTRFWKEVEDGLKSSFSSGINPGYKG